MKVLIVCSYNSGRISPFIQDQVIELEKLGVKFDFFLIKGKGTLGYLSNLIRYYKRILSFNPDLIHAHFGFSGLLACLQIWKPVIVTFHGSDINNKFNRAVSKIVMLLCSKSIFVSHNLKLAAGSKDGIVIPCGVDLNIFKPIDKVWAREKMKINSDKKIILFSSSFDRPVKNSELAIKAVGSVSDVQLIELKNFSRYEVALLMNAADVCLLTSFSEGSPQFIKEALACNAIVVSTRVGDLSEYADDLFGFFYLDFTLDSCVKALNMALNCESFLLNFDSRNKVRQRFDNNIIADKLFKLYFSIS